MDEPRITRWLEDAPPSEAALRQRYAAEGMAPYMWSNGPRDVYAAHTHGYHKVLYVVRGAITFGLPDLAQEVTLRAGDRLDLPAGVRHNAVVGSEGVMCLEGHRNE